MQAQLRHVKEVGMAKVLIVLIPLALAIYTVIDAIQTEDSCVQYLPTGRVDPADPALRPDRDRRHRLARHGPAARPTERAPEAQPPVRPAWPRRRSGLPS